MNPESSMSPLDPEADPIEVAVAQHNEAMTLADLGQMEVAEAKCREALARFEDLEGATHPDAANVRRCLGEILSKQGKHQEGLAEARKSRAILEEVLPLIEGEDGHILLYQAMCLEAHCLRELGDYEVAAGIFRQAIENARKLSARDLPIEALNGLGIVGKYSGNFDRSAVAYSEALELSVECYGEKSPMTATLYHNIGGLAHAQGLYEQAELPGRRAWEIRRELVGHEHPATLADACAYAGILEGLGRLDEAQAIYDMALPLYLKIFGKDHYEIAATLHNMAAIAAAQGDLNGAEAQYRRALEIKIQLLTAEHPDSALTAANLAGVLADQAAQKPQAKEESIALFQHALRVFEAKLNAGHPSIAATRTNLEQVLQSGT